MPRPSHPPEARRLAQLVNSAATGGAGGAMRISDPKGAAAILVLIAPLPAQLSVGGRRHGLALVALRPADESPALSGAQLSQLFGLSEAEGRLAAALAAGRMLNEIASERGVKVTTLKAQLEAVFRKTGAGSQRDLVRLIGSLPQIRR